MARVSLMPAAAPDRRRDRAAAAPPDARRPARFHIAAAGDGEHAGMHVANLLGSAPMQPVTMTLPFSFSASPMAARLSALALSRKPQVLTMTRSAPRDGATAHSLPSGRLVMIRSLSTSALGQPSETKEMRGASPRAGGEGVGGRDVGHDRGGTRHFRIARRYGTPPDPSTAPGAPRHAELPLIGVPDAAVRAAWSSTDWASTLSNSSTSGWPR